VYAFFKMEFQICAKYNLGKKHKHEGSGKGGMYIAFELPAFVGVSKEVCGDCDDSTEGLTWNMPPRTNDLEGGDKGSAAGFERWEDSLYTPRTMPAGNSMPNDMIMRRMCVQRIPSYG
jgi:hypothetical protein